MERAQPLHDPRPPRERLAQEVLARKRTGAITEGLGGAIPPGRW